MQAWIITIAEWGKKYRGDFIAAEIAFLIPFFITVAIKGAGDLVALTSLVGLISVTLILIMGFEWVFLRLTRFWIRRKFSHPVKIGVFNGYLDSSKTGNLPNQPYTQYPPKKWYDELSSFEEYDLKWITASEVSDKFDVIINPFGEEYPEIDKSNLTTLKDIRKFVDNGGLFVNVAGLAFYYVWDGLKEDLSGPLYETYFVKKMPGYLMRVVQPKASHIRDSSLFNFFGIRTTFFDATILSVTSVSDKYFEGLDNIGGVEEVKEFRSAYRSRKEETKLIPILKAAHKITITTDDSKEKLIDFDCYPIAAVKYGKGHLLLSGMKLEKNRPEDFQKVLESIKCVIKKLWEKKGLYKNNNSLHFFFYYQDWGF